MTIDSSACFTAPEVTIVKCKALYPLATVVRFWSHINPTADSNSSCRQAWALQRFHLFATKAGISVLSTPGLIASVTALPPGDPPRTGYSRSRQPTDQGGENGGSGVRSMSVFPGLVSGGEWGLD